ncbi:hypothetical protein GCM10022212_10620 [Actimicrobium antarcticum]|uniref:Signal transduction histidine kinase internal region domain-containing protein n=1 Tax=Actimicrobium antarcticum TaxID=1051899 RepID=A0ABP7SVH8_9BURK
MLALVNLTVLIVILLQATSYLLGLIAFVDAALLLELLCMTSLVCLCGVRRVATRLTLWQQRAACAVIPALITLLELRGLMALDRWRHGFPETSIVNGMLAAGVFGIVIQHYFEVRTRAYSPALGEARLQALQARIRPHFLFNSLNAVLALIRREPRRAETALEDLAELFRVLMRDGRDLTSLDDEIRLCKQYLSIEKIRLGERLQVQWDTSAIHDEVLHNAQIPSLLLQPLLENAVHYGVEPIVEPALIRISLRRVRDTIHILISNPWHGDPTVARGNHMALDNIRGRLSLLYDLDARLTTSMVNGSFEVRLLIPYKKAT